MAVFGLTAPALAAPGTGGAHVAPPAKPPPSGGPPPTTPVSTAVLSADGRTAISPASAPGAVRTVIDAANQLTRAPYRYGGGHRSFVDSAYDCSGSVSYALHGGGLLSKPLDSSALMRWGRAGRGTWITVYSSPRHAFVVIAGLRFDTAGSGPRGPRWRLGARSSRGFAARHPDSL
jgi:cell wall-associated NlpC family hydrolase